MYIDNGKKQDGSTFRVVNRGSINTSSKIYLDDLEIEENEARTLDKVVKYQLFKSEGNVSGESSTAKDAVTVGEAGRCITGEEDTYGKTNCYQSTDTNSCILATFSCDTAFYIWSERRTKERMITVQGKTNVGCASTDGDCPI